MTTQVSSPTIQASCPGGHTMRSPGPNSASSPSSIYPHLDRITDPNTLRCELAVIREKWNGVRLHAGIGYVTPNDEHEGRGPAVRKAREAGLEAARLRRLSYHRNQDPKQPSRRPDDVV